MNEKTQLDGMTKKCPQCGLNLPPGMLEGLCPACLLQQATTETAAHPALPPFEPPPLEEVQRLFPSLEILSFLGKGGMGAVYKARQPALDRIVALKLLPSRQGGDPSFKDRFTREARALAKLSHPSIVAVHEFGEVQNHRYFIMEYVDGVNLRQLQKTKRLSPREALQIIPQICDALQYAHDQGVVHRDIKPENLMVDRKGRIIITDFGLAKMLDLSIQDFRLTGEGQVMGTPHYMAPEQLEQPWSVDHRADIYSLGVVLYEMLTGELPLGKFQSPSKKIQIDVRLDEIVLHALEKEPDRRYQHASQVGKDLETISSASHPIQPLAETNRPPIPEPAGPTAEETAKLKAFRTKISFKANAILTIGLAGLIFFLFYDNYGFHTLFASIPFLGGRHAQIPEELHRIWSATIDLWRSLAVITIIGAVRFRQLRHYTLALAGTIGALIASLAMCVFFLTSASIAMSVAFPAALLASYISLKTLLKPDIRKIFQLGDDAYYASLSKSSPKWSALACWGAILVAINLTDAAINAVLNLFGFAGWLQEVGMSWRSIIMTGLWTLPWLSALLGWLGWEEIQRSSGKMLGMGFAFITLLYLPFAQPRLVFYFRDATINDYTGLMTCWVLGTLVLVGGAFWLFQRRERVFLAGIEACSLKTWWPMQSKALWIPRLVIILFGSYSAFLFLGIRSQSSWKEERADIVKLSGHKHQSSTISTHRLDYRWQSYSVEIKSATALDSTNDICWLPDGNLLCGTIEQCNQSMIHTGSSRRIALLIDVPKTLPDVSVIPLEIHSDGVLIAPISFFQTKNESPNQQSIVFILKVPTKSRTLDLAFGMPNGKWDDTDAGWNYKDGLPRHPERTLWRYGHQFEIRPYETDVTTARFKIAYSLALKNRLWIERLIVLDKGGRIHEPAIEALSLHPKFNDRNDYVYSDNRFNDLGKADIKTLRLQTRTLRYVHFNNISVIPGVRSQPEMVIDEKSAMD